MVRSSVDGVRRVLLGYADRGVLRGLSEVEKGSFSFIWFYDHQMELTLDADRGVLSFSRLLPGVPARSAFYGELKNFIRDCHDPALPEHRRVDRRRASATCANQRGYVSLSLKVKDMQYEYGAKKIVNLVHELFVHLREAHPDYLAENFDVPQE